MTLLRDLSGRPAPATDRAPAARAIGATKTYGKVDN
jgi:hypothetical protein